MIYLLPFYEHINIVYTFLCLQEGRESEVGENALWQGLCPSGVCTLSLYKRMKMALNFYFADVEIIATPSTALLLPILPLDPSCRPVLHHTTHFSSKSASENYPASQYWVMAMFGVNFRI